MSIAKLPFLATGLVATYSIQTAPNPYVPASKRPKDVGAFERIMSSVVPLNVVFVRTWTSVPLLLEGAIILAKRFPSNEVSNWVLRVLARYDTNLLECIVLSPAFVATCAVGTLAALVRAQCYSTLGKLFTYEVTIRDEHRLVTDGPYAYVRHPSYTTYMLGTAAIGLMPFTRGSWLRESGVLHTTAWVRVPYAFGALWAAYVCANMVLRTKTEDRLLRSRFGAEWDEYASRVPYRLIPYVY